MDSFMKKWKNRAVSMGILVCMIIYTVAGYRILQYYVDAACSIVPQSDNLLISGHHMKDGQMCRTNGMWAESLF